MSSTIKWGNKDGVWFIGEFGHFFCECALSLKIIGKIFFYIVFKPAVNPIQQLGHRTLTRNKRRVRGIIYHPSRHFGNRMVNLANGVVQTKNSKSNGFSLGVDIRVPCNMGSMEKSRGKL